jgi:hypothetical protein
MLPATTRIITVDSINDEISDTGLLNRLWKRGIGSKDASVDGKASAAAKSAAESVESVKSGDYESSSDEDDKKLAAVSAEGSSSVEIHCSTPRVHAEGDTEDWQMINLDEHLVLPTTSQSSSPAPATAAMPSLATGLQSMKTAYGCDVTSALPDDRRHMYEWYAHVANANRGGDAQTTSTARLLSPDVDARLTPALYVDSSYGLASELRVSAKSMRIYEQHVLKCVHATASTQFTG